MFIIAQFDIIILGDRMNENSEKGIYYELFEKTIEPGVDIEYVISQIKEVHSKDAGWVVGNPISIPNSNGSINLQIPLTKYDLKQSDGYGRSR